LNDVCPGGSPPSKWGPPLGRSVGLLSSPPPGALARGRAPKEVSPVGSRASQWAPRGARHWPAELTARWRARLRPSAERGFPSGVPSIAVGSPWGEAWARGARRPLARSLAAERPQRFARWGAER